MSQIFGGLYNSLNVELLQIQSLIKGARCVRKCEENVNVETDLLSLAEEIVEESRETLKELNQEYCKLEKEEKKPASPSTPPKRGAKL